MWNSVWIFCSTKKVLSYLASSNQLIDLLHHSLCCFCQHEINSMCSLQEYMLNDITAAPTFVQLFQMWEKARERLLLYALLSKPLWQKIYKIDITVLCCLLFLGKCVTSQFSYRCLLYIHRYNYYVKWLSFAIEIITGISTHEKQNWNSTIVRNKGKFISQDNVICFRTLYIFHVKL